MGDLGRSSAALTAKSMTITSARCWTELDKRLMRTGSGGYEVKLSEATERRIRGSGHPCRRA